MRVSLCAAFIALPLLAGCAPRLHIRLPLFPPPILVPVIIESRHGASVYIDGSVQVVVPIDRRERLPPCRSASDEGCEH